MVDSNDGTVYSGIRIELPSFPESRGDGYVPERIVDPHGDYQDIIAVNKAIDGVRIRLFKVNALLKHVERKAIEAQAAYDRMFNRAFLDAEGRTAEMKRCIAQIQTEPEQNKVLVAQQMAKELSRQSRQMSMELEALKTVSYNIRKVSDL